MDRLSDDADYGFPERGALAYLIGYLSEMGEAQSSGVGMAAISWQEIRAWTELMGVTLTSGESKAVRMLSAAYVAEYYRADGKDCASPCAKEVSPETLNNKIKSLFAMLRK